MAASRKGLAPLGTTVHSTQSLLPYEIQKQDASTDGPISLLSEDVSRPNSAESPPPLRPTNLPPLVPKDTFSPFKRLHPTMRLPKAAAPIRMPPLPAVPTTDARFDPRGQGSFPRRAHPPRQEKAEEKALTWVPERSAIPFEDLLRCYVPDAELKFSSTHNPLEKYDAGIVEDDAAGLTQRVRDAQTTGGLPARSRYFAPDGSFVWAACHVLEVVRVPHTNWALDEFTITWDDHPDAEPKQVYRLNLCLNTDDPSDLSERIRAARYEKQIADWQREYDAFTDSLPPIAALLMTDEETTQRILARADAALAEARPDVVDQCVSDLQDMYEYAYKSDRIRARLSQGERVVYDHAGPKGKSEIDITFNHLPEPPMGAEIPMVAVAMDLRGEDSDSRELMGQTGGSALTAPSEWPFATEAEAAAAEAERLERAAMAAEVGEEGASWLPGEDDEMDDVDENPLLVQTWMGPEDESFAARFASIASVLPLAEPRLLACLQSFYSALNVSQSWLIDTQMVLLTRPAPLDDLVEHMMASIAEGSENVCTSWVLRVVKELEDVANLMGETFRLMGTEEGKPPSAPTLRFVKRVTLEMATMLRSVTIGSLDTFVALFRQFKATANNAQAGYPAPGLEAWGADLYCSTLPPLVQVSLVFDQGSDVEVPEGEEQHMERGLRMSPSTQEIESRMLDIFNEMIALTRSVEDISVRLGAAAAAAGADPEEENSAPEAAQLPSVAHNDPEATALRAELLELLSSNLTPVDDMLRAFGDFDELIHLDPEATLADWEAAKPTMAQSFEEARRFASIADAVARRSASVVNFRLVRVSMADAQKALVAKAMKMRSGMLAVGVRTWNSDVASVKAVYDDMCQKLGEDPASPEVLDELITFSEEVDSQLEALEERIEVAVTQYGDLISEQWLLTEKESARYWGLLHDPIRFAAVSGDWKRRSGQARMKFMDELKKDQVKLTKDFVELDKTVTEFVKMGDLSKVEERFNQVLDIHGMLEEHGKRSELYQSREEIFQLKQTDWPQKEAIYKNFEPNSKLWELCAAFSREVPEWRDGPLEEVDAEQVQARVEEWYRGSGKLTKLLVGPPATVVLEMRKLLEEFMDKIPLITALCNPGMQIRHWIAVSEEVGQEVRKTEDFTLSSALSMGLGDHLERIQEISENASKEFSLEKALVKMEGEWTGVAFEFTKWRDTGTYKLKALDDLQMLLDDHIVKTQSMRASPYIGPHEDAVKIWEDTLNQAQSILDQWLKCQDGWLYLEPIFGSEDIMQQMPTEGAKFRSVDASWREMMSKAVKNPEALAVTSDPAMLSTLLECNQLLDQIQKGLNEYLETKRVAFPRFYFLSDPELLAILSETKDPTRVQPFMSKCFEGINSLDFDKEMVVRGMISAEGERVALDPFEPNKANGAVEKWLIECEDAMKAAVKREMLASTEDYQGRTRTDWTLAWPGQVVLGVDCLYWTNEVAAAILAGTLQDYANKCTEELMKVVAMVRGRLNKMNRTTLAALIVIDVHARDTVQQLSDQGVTSDTEFEWISQLRYSWEDGDLIVRMINARLDYGYEYLGNGGRLVITPLTDRCYRTLMGALHLNFGGAPEGPAGTGKTETTKDLAKALAMQCVVFNCSDQMEYQAMGKMFKGLASAGSWACFDEFNRINLEVLSVIAQQILTIQRAKALNKKLFDFEGSTITLKVSCNVFITMNPGYAGRSELPDNLKALFRSVAMMVPDYALISEITLYSAGYEQARGLARKLVSTYTLCSEQLSSQKHYDYGMRAVMSVLRAAAANKQKPELAVLNEDILMLRSIKDVNLPKFLAPDIPLFNGILSDLFPGVELPEPDYNLLDIAVKETCEEKNLQPTPVFIQKIHELYEMILVRHGLMLVGYSFGAKTALYESLAGGLGKLEKRKQLGEVRVNTRVMNPKAVYIDQLYGCIDKVSKEWKNGVLADEFRKAYQAGVGHDAIKDRQWVILDGPVDAVWIENMNTVLDDNKKLCLNSGETISMTPQMNMIFEVQDLLQASPATVSRCGMIYVEPSSMGWEPLMESWLNTATETLTPFVPRIRALMFWFVPATIGFVRRNCKEPVSTLDIGLVTSLMRLFDALSEHFVGRAADPHAGPDAQPLPPQEVLKEKDLAKTLDGIFLMAAIWSLGGTVDAAGRAPFSEFFRKLAAAEVTADPERSDFDLGPGIEIAYPEDEKARKMGVNLPIDNTLFDYVFLGEKAQWKHWLETEKIDPPGEELEFNQLIIPTVDTIRYSYVFNKMTMARKPVLFCGPTGTGKTVYVQSGLKALDGTKWSSIQTGFSAQTNANQIQDIIDNKLKQRRRGVLGPPIGTRCVIFVDDLNMPTPEVYGAQPPIELLRQFSDFGGWYNRDENSFTTLVDVQLCAAMGPPGGGRNEITPRLLRHFSVVSVTDFDDAAFQGIYGSIVDWWFRRTKVADDVRGKAAAMVRATVSIYNTVRAELLPTPAKSHYVYNMRDISKVFQGMQMLGSTVEDVRGLTRLWVHECLRVFHDRLIDDTDRLWFCSLVKDCVNDQLGQKFDKVFADPTTGKAPELADLRKLMYADFQVMGADPQKYAEVEDVGGLLSTMVEYLGNYNMEHKNGMNLVLFQYAAEHICRVSRVIKQPYGNCMLVGIGGSGRQSLTRLATYMADYQLATIELTKSYSMNDWREDLKRVLDQAGGLNKPTVFMIADTQLKEEAFLEDINNILNTGEVPNLFAKDEVAMLTEKVAKRAKAAGRGLGMEELYAFFVEECRRNLHMVLAMSPVGEAFRIRLRKFPSLVNCCTINWFQEWPADALKAVASQFMADVDFDTEEVRAAVEDMCMSIHVDVRNLADEFRSSLGRPYYTTPTSYLELISTYKTLLNQKRMAVSRQQTRYERGLDKVINAERDVNIMKEELIALQPKLVQTSKEVAEALVVVDKETAAAQVTKDAVLKDEAAASEKAAAANAIKEDCEADLAKAMPALNAALKEVDKLTKNDIQQVKAMKNPPGPVKVVMEAVCLLFDQKPVRMADPDNPGKKFDNFWPASLSLLSQMDFMKQLKDYDKDNIQEAVISKIDVYVEMNEFVPEVVKKSSSAAYGISQWVRAMRTYFYVSRDVAPKRAKLKAAEEELEGVMSALAIKKAELKAVEDKIAALNADLKKNLDEKQRLEDEADLCEKKLDRAGKLISGLGGEKTRWGEQCKILGQNLEDLTGDIMLSAGYIAYLGAFTSEFRHKAVTAWATACRAAKIPCSSTFTLEGVMGEPVKIREWAIQGLPNDPFSIDNAIVMASAKRWPLLIDPQGQANKWIRNMEEANQLHVIKLTDKNFVRTLENCIPLGFPVLLENVGEELDPTLEPLLLRSVYKDGTQSMIKLGDKGIEWTDNFRFYVTTKLRNPHYLPEIAVKVTLLNFMITPTGLQDQILGIVVQMERPDLQEAKEKLVLQSADNERQLKEIEDQIIEVLSSSEGNILEDETAINIITVAKTKSNEIEKSKVAARATEEKIDASRAGYQPVAKHAAALFFCVSDMAFIEPMYQYSLAWFISLFEETIKAAAKPKGSSPQETVSMRIDALEEHFNYSLYKMICRSLFEKDKLMFGLMLCITLEDKIRGKINPDEFRFLLTGGISTHEPPANPYDWLPTRQWAEVVKLTHLSPAFKDLQSNVEGNEHVWRAWYDATDPNSHEVPEPFKSTLDGLQHLLLMRVIRPDKLTFSVIQYVIDTMGRQFVEPPPFNLEACFNDSNALSPLIFVLSPGADPMTPILKLADKLGVRVESISLGQGQGPAAERLIAAGRTEGFWVCLQNCHLAESWMPTLERICEKFTAPGLDAPDGRFRLWLTSYPSEAFPVAVLQNGIKMTSDPPKGLRANLLQSYVSDPVNDPDFFNGCDRPTEFKRLLYGLCFFHAVIQERLKFGPLGWNVQYGFSSPDFIISVRQLQMFLNEYAEALPMKVLNYLTGECNYGGRVTDAKDRRTMSSLLSIFYNEDAVMMDDYKFSPSGRYIVPACSTHEEFVDHIRELPLTAEPEIFGLHANADITKDQQETDLFLSSILLTQSQSSGGAATSRDALLDEMCGEIIGKMPQPFDIEMVRYKYPVDYHESMNTVLTQELVRYNWLIEIIHATLADLRKALKGLVVMSGDLEAVANAMFDGKVPDAWKAKSYPSIKGLTSYVNDLCERLAGFEAWIQNGAPIVYWMSGFFFSHAFLTGVKQNFARKGKIPIDTVSWNFVCMPKKEPEEKPADGAYVRGMFLEGARWDYGSMQLEESELKVLFSPGPMLLLEPMVVDDIPSFPHYSCPLYVEPQRKGVLQTTGHSSNFVMDIRLPSNREQDHWIRRGVAMLLSLGD